MLGRRGLRIRTLRRLPLYVLAQRMLQRKLHIVRFLRAGVSLRALAPIAPELDVGAAAAQIDGRSGVCAPSAERETFAAQIDIAAPLVRQKQVAAQLRRDRETRAERFG